MGNSSAGHNTDEEKIKAHRELLLKVYSTAIDEYQFNVQLSWDRTKFFIILSSGLMAAGVGLIKVAQDSAQTSSFLSIYFVLSALINFFGLNTVSVGKAYYREAVFTKTVVERELGLHKAVGDLPDPRANLSISVTDGQRNLAKVLFGRDRPQERRRLIPQTITDHSQAIFWAMIVINSIGAMIAGFNAAHQAFD